MNGEPLGLWNSNKASGITGASMRTITEDEQAEKGLSLNGKGYAQIDVGNWNPRMRTAILLSFMTYSPDGLLFFIGKRVSFKMSLSLLLSVYTISMTHFRPTTLP